ncbi:MAG: STAS domain-containing protein [Candidatus Saccharimonas sp.]|nr:STAS domain-containing protein [Planctomycetaceae bacterium]
MAALSEFKPVYFTIVDRGTVVVARFAKTGLSEVVNIEQLGQELSKLVDQFGCRRLVVNYEIVTLITSAALGKFIALHRNLHRREGRLVLCGVAGMVQDVLNATKLNEYFTVTSTVDEAVALLNEGTSGDSAKSA